MTFMAKRGESGEVRVFLSTIITAFGGFLRFRFVFRSPCTNFR